MCLQKIKKPGRPLVFYFFWTLIKKEDALVHISKAFRNPVVNFMLSSATLNFCHSPTPCIDYRSWPWKKPGVSNCLPENNRAPPSAWWCAHTGTVFKVAIMNHHDHVSSKDLIPWELCQKKQNAQNFRFLYLFVPYCVKHSKSKLT